MTNKSEGSNDTSKVSSTIISVDTNKDANIDEEKKKQ